MRFQPTAMNRYCASPQAQSAITIHNSNPQPFSYEELIAITGNGHPQSKQYMGYASIQGSTELRSHISALYVHLRENNIATFAGAQEAIFCSMHSLLNKGENVVAITPIFQSLVNTTSEIGCEIKYISLLAENSWKLDMGKLADLIRADCKLLILNFPHNPTGAMISQEELLEIISLCEKYDCWIFSDEVFRGLEYTPAKRLPAVADIYPKSISLSVFSKAFALPGIRIGWLASQDQNILQRTLEIKDYLSICNSQLDEQLAIKVLPKYNEIWERNRMLIVNNLQHLEKFMLKNQLRFKFIKPAAGCVCFPLLKDIDSIDYTKKLLIENNLLAFPAHLFSTTLNGFRLGFGDEEKTSLLTDL